MWRPVEKSCANSEDAAPKSSPWEREGAPQDAEGEAT